MARNYEDENALKQYLLRQLSDSEQRTIEQRLLTDDDLFDELGLMEDDVIDRYLSGELSDKESKAFEQTFLANPERKQKLKFAKSVRRLASSSLGRKDLEPRKVVPRSWWQKSFAGLPAPSLAMAAVVVIVVGLALAVWMVAFRQSAVDRGLIALNNAYSQERPIQARITQFNYAPFITKRGSGTNKVNEPERQRAELTLLEALNKKPTADVRHALGRVYLAKNDLDRAIEQFNEALKADSGNAQIYADLGAAWLEKGKANTDKAKSDPAGPAGGKSLEELGRSLEYLSEALKLNSNLLEALFNRALVHQFMLVPRQAEADWQEYLQKDSTSAWADEARSNLRLISSSRVAPATSSEVLAKFLVAFQNGADDQAWQVLSGNKEMIASKFIPQELAKAYVRDGADSSSADSERYLRALTYAGSLELKRARDPFVAELAAYYSGTSPEQRLLLNEAHAALTAGYARCLETQYKDALDNFLSARGLFEKARDEWEARLNDYWIGYCYSQIDQLKESGVLLEALADFCEAKHYRWLLGQASCWIANNYAELGDHSRSVQQYERALLIAEEIDDAYNRQKILSQLASEYDQLGQHERALGYHWRCLQVAGSNDPSVRQMWRNYLYATRTFIALKLYHAASAFGGEMLQVALEDIREPGVSHFSYLYLGQIYGGLGQYEKAILLTSDSLSVGAAIKDKAARKMTVDSVLQIAQLRRQSGKCASALKGYDEAIDTYDKMELRLYQYQAHKGRLLCYVALADESGINMELPIVLQQFEQYRRKITEKQNRDTFFDKEQGVYDIATNHAYLKGDNLAAFDYSESARARSLLDSRTNSAQPSVAASQTETELAKVSQPLSVAEIRGKLPTNVQVVEYAVLEDKTLIWVITRNSFESQQNNISARDLQARVTAYVKLMNSGPHSAAESNDLGKELYERLIEPVAGLLDPNKVLCLVPDKALSYLPFAALISPSSGQYLISQFSLLSSPSLNVFLNCSESAVAKVNKQSETILTVGNPHFDHGDYPSLSDLPASGREAQEIGKNYALAYEFIGPHASKSAIERRLSDADIIHFAGHYVVDEQQPMLSRLVLAKERGSDAANDGALTASDLTGRKLPRTKLVVLSACQTAGENYYNGEGMTGISRTFLETGIPLVVASQWSVESESTAELMLKFHRYRKLPGISTVAALRKAQLEMLNEPGGLYRNPYYWAAFQAIGGYADF